MSSDAPKDLMLKVATAVAMLVVIVGGSLYMGAVMAPDKPTATSPLRAVATEPIPTTPTGVRPDIRDLRPPSEGKGVGPGIDPDPDEPEESEEADSAVVLMPALSLPGVIALATRPVVLPASQLDDARSLLESQLDAVETCWRDQVEDPQTSAKVFVHFRVTDGRAAGVSVQLDGVREPLIGSCVRDLMKGLDVSGLDDGTSIYWPIKLDKKLGALL
jgi:hypothetical protein